MDSPSTDFAEPERIELIKKLHNWNEGEPVATEAWACIWLSDLGKLRKLVDGVLKDCRARYVRTYAIHSREHFF